MLSLMGILIRLGKHLLSPFSRFLSVSGALILKRTKLQSGGACAVAQSAPCLACCDSPASQRVNDLCVIVSCSSLFFRVLVYTVIFQFACIHAYSLLVGLPLHVCMCVCVCVCVCGSSMLVTYIYIYIY